MTKKDLQNLFNFDDILDFPSAITRIIEGDESVRNKVYLELINLNGDMSYDWFQGIYEEEFAQRNQNKQDFTPGSIGALLSSLTGCEMGKIYEPTAGNGSLIISNWNFRKNKLGYKFRVEEHPVECWELSSRSIPILLLNLSIRGIVGEVFHGDVLTREIKSRYILSKNYPFSKITKI